jgi:hypothetical protein
MTVSSNLEVGLDMTVGSSMTVSSNLEVGLDMTVGSNMTVSSNLEVGKDLEIGSNVIIGEHLTVGTSLNVAGSSLECDEQTLTINVPTHLSRSVSIYQEDGALLDRDSNLFRIGYSNHPEWFQISSDTTGKVSLGLGVSNLSETLDEMRTTYTNGASVSMVVADGDLVMTSNASITVEDSGFFYGDGRHLSNIDAGKITNITGTLSGNIFPPGVGFIVHDNSESNQLEVIGDMYVHSNLRIQDDLFVNGQMFPIPTGPEDHGKILATNANGDFELVSVFSDEHYAEFKSLHGIPRTGVPMEEVSGVFYFGITRYWLDGWEGKVFDCTLASLPPNTDGSGVNDIEVVEEITASNNLHFINVSLVTETGKFLSSNCGIATGPPSAPDYYYFLGVLDPNTALFRNKFKLDFESYYNGRAGDQLWPHGDLGFGYCVDLDFVSMPHENLHPDGTKFYTVEFINMYNVTTYDATDTSADPSTRYLSYQTEQGRRTNYYRYNSSASPYYEAIQNDNYGLYPHITYKKWKNMENPNEVKFYDRLYTPDLGWGITDGVLDNVFTLNHIFDRFSTYIPTGGNDWMFELWLKTYAYIRDGNVGTDTSDIIGDPNHAVFLQNMYETNVTYVEDGHNLLIVPNINGHLLDDGGNGPMINKNYSILFSSNAFPLDLYPPLSP